MNRTKIPTGVLIAAVFFLAANLRAPIVSAGPVLHSISEALHLSETALGLLGTLPVLTFAAVSPFVRRLAGRLGLERAVLAGLAVLLAGAVVRVSYPSAAVLMIGTVMLCAGVAVGNVLLAGAIRRDFPNHVEKMSSFQMFTFGIFQASAAAFSVPIASAFGWKTAITCWALMTIPAMLLWGYISRRRASEKPAAPANSAPAAPINVWRSALAWKISVFMGLQSMMYYTLANWLPLFLQWRGMTETKAGYVMAVFQAITIPAVIAITPLAERAKNMSVLLCASAVTILIGIAGFWYLPVDWAWLAAVIGGSGSAASFTFCLMLYALRGRDAGEAAALSGMSQTVGYLIAAAGPVLLGRLLESSGGWGVPWAALISLAVLMILSGIPAGRKGAL